MKERIWDKNVPEKDGLYWLLKLNKKIEEKYNPCVIWLTIREPFEGRDYTYYECIASDEIFWLRDEINIRFASHDPYPPLPSLTL